MEGDEQPRAVRAGRRARAAALAADADGPAIVQEEGGRDDAPPPRKPISADDGEGGPSIEVDNDESDAPVPAARRGGFNLDSPSGNAAPAAPAVGGYGVDNIPRPPPDTEISADGAKYAGVSRRKQDQRQREEEEKLKAKNKYDEMSDRAGNFDSILEIEEEGKEDLTGVVAEAPKVRINKVQNITDLDEDMQFRLPSTDDRDIDLSILTSFLCSSEQVQEDDEIWDADMLFTNVASELHQEKERAEGPTEKDGKEEHLDQL